MANCGHNAGGDRSWTVILLIVILMQNHVTRTAIAIEMKRISQPMPLFNHRENQPQPHAAPTDKSAVYTLHDQQKKHGVMARLSIWKPEALDSEMSMAYVGVASGDSSTLNMIWAGWMVDPPNFREPKYFIYWTNDAGRNTGCFDLHCPGFHKTKPDFDFNRTIDQVSTYDELQHYVTIKINQRRRTRAWHFLLNDEEIGFLPNSLFTSLAEGSDEVSWGALVSDEHTLPHATTTQMGSGHFPHEGFGKAGSFDQMQYVRSDPYRTVRPKFSGLHYTITHQGCYNLSRVTMTHDAGVNFYYGGPGYSPTCLH